MNTRSAKCRRLLGSTFLMLCGTVGIGAFAAPAGAAAHWSNARIGRALAPYDEAIDNVDGQGAYTRYAKEAAFLATHASGKVRRDLLTAARTGFAYVKLPANAPKKHFNQVVGAFAKAQTQMLSDLPSLLAAETAPTTTTTTAPPETPAQYEAACSASPDYGDLTSPNAQPGQCVTYEAQIFQYDSRTGKNEMLVDVTDLGDDIWDNTVELQIPDSVAAQNFIDNNIIRFWGPTGSPDTYTTASGGSNTVPVVDVKYAVLVSSS